MNVLAVVTAESSAPAGAFYDKWVDVRSHPEWSHGVAWLTLEGPLREGARGVVKPLKGPQSRFVVSALRPGSLYADTTMLPGARLTFSHEATPRGTGSRVEVRVSLTGPLRRLWTRILGRGLQQSVEEDVQRLVGLIERVRA